MSLFARLKAGFAAVLRRRHLDAEMEEELRSHIELRTQSKIEVGMKAEEARLAALRQFGWVESIKEVCREQRPGRWLENLLQDLRFGLRQLRKNPGPTLLAMLILALGIGGNTAIFSVVEKTILNPIPGRQTDQLVVLHEVDSVHESRWNVSPPMFADLAAYTNIFKSLSAYFQGVEALTLERGANRVKLHGARITPGFFDTLGVRPLAGRVFLPQEGSQGSDSVLVAGYGLWKDQFGGDAGFLGRNITLDGRSFTVVGIMPPTFQFPFSPGENQFWIPHQFGSEETANPDFNRDRVWSAIGRLHDGVSLEQTRALVNTVTERRQREFPESNTRWVTETQYLRGTFVGQTLRITFWSLQAAMLIVLLIACANVGTLLLSRAAARRAEFSIRLAIGAARIRLVRQLLTESLVLAGAAGTLGLLLACAGIRALGSLYLGDLPRMKEIGLDWTVLALTFLASTTSGLLFGLAPAWLVSRFRLNDSLKEVALQQSVGVIQAVFQDGLIVVQISLALVLLAGAALMIQSTARLLRVDPGLDPTGLYRLRYESDKLMKITRPDFEAAQARGLTRREAIADWWSQEIARELQWDESMVEKLRAVPGIQAAAINVNSGGTFGFGDFHIEGRDDAVKLSPSPIGIRAGDYFRTLRLPLIAGRFLAKEDCVPGQRAVVVNQELSRRCWPGQDPLGKRLISAQKDDHQEFVVVGVVKDIRDWRKDTPPEPTFFEPVERLTRFSPTRGGFMLRSSLDPDSLRKLVANLGRDASPSVEVAGFYSVAAQLHASTAPRRVYMWLLNSMGALALLLSALGVYAVMAYSVARRTREIGVRIALGATRSQIARLMLGRSVRLLVQGMVLGGVAAFALARYLESLLYEVRPDDPWTFVGALVTLGMAAFFASYLPVRRASLVDPMIALRYE